MEHIPRLLFWLIVPIAIIGGLTTWLVLVVARWERRRHEGLRAAIQALGLLDDPSAAARGWKYLKRGNWQGVDLAIGERSHSRMTSEGPRTSNCLEVVSRARTDLGRYRLPHRHLGGTEAGFPARTGDPSFDGQFTIIDEAREDQRRQSPFDAHPPSPQVPWLDDTVRRLVSATGELQILIVSDQDVSVVLRWYDEKSFQNAVELALYLARWPGGQAAAYR